MVTTMNAWEAIVEAGKAHRSWNSIPSPANAVTVINGRPIQVTGQAAVQVKKGWRGHSVVFFRYLDDDAPQMDKMPAAQFNIATQREYRRLSRIGAP